MQLDVTASVRRLHTPCALPPQNSRKTVMTKLQRAHSLAPMKILDQSDRGAAGGATPASLLQLADTATNLPASILASMIEKEARAHAAAVLLGVFDARAAVAAVIGDRSFARALKRMKSGAAGSGRTIFADACIAPLSLLRLRMDDQSIPDISRSYLAGIVHARQPPRSFRQ